MMNLWFFVVVINGFMMFMLICVNDFEKGMVVKICNMMLFLYVCFIW